MLLNLYYGSLEGKAGTIVETFLIQSTVRFLTEALQFTSLPISVPTGEDEHGPLRGHIRRDNIRRMQLAPKHKCF